LAACSRPVHVLQSGARAWIGRVLWRDRLRPWRLLR
jgi:hypothetical protein